MAALTVHDLVDARLNSDQDADTKIAIVEESIQSAIRQNQVSLRQALQSRLIRLLNELERYPKALQSASELVRELKKIDDTRVLLEVYLEESKAYYFLSSLSKARASLTTARAIANSAYVPPQMQAGLDMQSGILHVADERDFHTAFSYFFEAFEGFDLIGQSEQAMLALKYMLLCKVMLGKSEEINILVSQKATFKYHGGEITAMLAISKAAQNRSLKEFNEAFGNYREKLQCDVVIRKHFGTLSNTMLENELCRRIEPYSFVQISHIAKAIGLPIEKVEKKLAQMILDKKFRGSLHQGDGMLAVYNTLPDDNMYDLAVKNLQKLNEMLDVLYKKAQKML